MATIDADLAHRPSEWKHAEKFSLRAEPIRGPGKAVPSRKNGEIEDQRSRYEVAGSRKRDGNFRRGSDSRKLGRYAREGKSAFLETKILGGVSKGLLVANKICALGRKY